VPCLPAGSFARILQAEGAGLGKEPQDLLVGPYEAFAFFIKVHELEPGLSGFMNSDFGLRSAVVPPARACESALSRDRWDFSASLKESGPCRSKHSPWAAATSLPFAEHCTFAHPRLLPVPQLKHGGNRRRLDRVAQGGGSERNWGGGLLLRWFLHHGSEFNRC
jgi:hypothetical protein